MIRVVRNPWAHLPSAAPFVLPEDRQAVLAFNAGLKAGSPYWIDVDEVVPEPFIGNVREAPVVVLQLNPGLNRELDPPSHAEPSFRQALFSNLRHESCEWPFYFFNPSFFESHPGGKWWSGKTKELRRAVRMEVLARRLAVVEWFPYKSKRYRECQVASQKYGFWLVEQAVERGALIIVSRRLRQWELAVPALQSYDRKITLSSVQNITLSANNLLHRGEKSGDAWSMLIGALTS